MTNNMHDREEASPRIYELKCETFIVGGKGGQGDFMVKVERGVTITLSREREEKDESFVLSMPQILALVERCKKVKGQIR